MMKILIYVCLLMLFLGSCATLQNNAKYELADGKYKLKSKGKKITCYVENNPDSIIVYELPSKIATNLPNQVNTHLPEKQRLSQSSLDVDVLTAFFKIRLKEEQILPAQLNTNFNGNIYVGYRTDVYQIQYKKNPLGVYQRQINHLGFSGGLFFGLGNSAITPSTTNNAISSEYDGIVFQKGLAGIMALNKLTVGLSVGFDRLLDNNHTFWIYENKPWFGLVLGLNLN